MDEVKKIDNTLMRIWLETIESIVGPNGLKAILNHAHLHHYIDNFPPDDDLVAVPIHDVQALHRSLIELFGSRGAWGLQVRVGREITRIFIEKRSAMIKSLKTALRLLPETKRMQISLDNFKKEFESRFSSTQGTIEIIEEPEYFIITHRENYLSEGIVSEIPVCGAAVGNFQYMLEWSTGHRHHVNEVECRAMGYPADVFRIWKKHE